MELTVASAEVQTLKADGKPWDDFGQRVPKEELAAFFAQSLDGQLERLAATTGAPNPPDVFVRVFVGDELVLETDTVESYDPTWPREEAASLHVTAGTRLKIQVWDRDLVIHDLIGETAVTVPQRPGDGRWLVPHFGQVRRLLLRLE